MSTSQGRRLHKRDSLTSSHWSLSLEILRETPRPHVLEQGLQEVVWVMQFLCQLWVSAGRAEKASIAWRGDVFLPLLGSSQIHCSQHCPGTLTRLGLWHQTRGGCDSVHSDTQPMAPFTHTHWYLQLGLKLCPLRYITPSCSQPVPTISRLVSAVVTVQSLVIVAGVGLVAHLVHLPGTGLTAVTAVHQQTHTRWAARGLLGTLAGPFTVLRAVKGLVDCCGGRHGCGVLAKHLLNRGSC